MALKDRIARQPASNTAAQPFRRPNGRASYPHRITLDLDRERYDWLRKQAYEGRVPAAGILRAALGLLAEHPELLAQIIARAQDEHPPPQ